MRRIFTLFVLLTSLSAQSQINLTASSGTATGTYTTLKAAFDAINAGTHTGTINMSITAGTTETASAVLNASGSGSASYTAVTIKPALSTTPIITGAVVSAPLVKILGNNVTIDGSNTLGGTTKDLTISNTGATAPNILVIGSTGTTPITGVTVKNSNLINGLNTSSGIVICDGATLGNAGYFNNITLQNNSVQKSYIGIYSTATVAAGNGSGLTISNNDLATTGANAIRYVGIYAQGVDGATISGNAIGNFDNAIGEFDRGIWLATSTVNTTVSTNNISNLTYPGTGNFAPIPIAVSSGSATANINVTGNTINNITSSGTTIPYGIYVFSTTASVTVQKNKISNIINTNTGGYGAAGIALASTSTSANILVSNNFISNVIGYGYATGAGLNDNGYGITVSAGAGYNIYFNTVSLSANQTVAGNPAAINVTNGVTAAGAINLVNNIFSNTQTITGARYAIYSGAANTVFGTINYNDYYSTGTALGYIGSDRPVIADLQAGFGGNTNSKAVLPVFVSATDLHLTSVTANAQFDNAGTPLAAVTTDIDGNLRSATTPDLGGAEFSSVVPVTFSSFKGEKVNNSTNKLTWSVITEINNTGFELQRSADGINFSKIAFVGTKAENGNSNLLLQYNFDDLKTLSGSNYYRLKQIDKDGKSNFSIIVLIKGAKINEVEFSSLYPNPAKDKINLVIASSTSAALSLVITDIAGKPVMQQSLQTVAGDNLKQLNIASLATGVYYIKAVRADGYTTTALKFIKQ